MGAYVSVVTDIPINIIALVCCLFFVLLNLIGVKAAGRVQVFLVIGLLVILLVYALWGIKEVNPVNYSPFFSKGLDGVLITASFVFISYGGLTKVAVLAEETKNSLCRGSLYRHLHPIGRAILKAGIVGHGRLQYSDLALYLRKFDPDFIPGK